MNIELQDTASIYRKAISETVVQKKIDILRNELLAPYRCVFEAFGVPMKSPSPGGFDAVSMVENWGYMTPYALDMAGTDLLIELEESDAWNVAFESMKAAADRFEPYADRIPLKNVRLGLFLSDPKKVDPIDRGFFGFGGIPGYIMISFSEPNDYSLRRLPAAIAHECHHGIRNSIFRWDLLYLTLGSYMVLEGLAESFATAKYGKGMLGHFIADFDEEEMPWTKEIFFNSINVKGFDNARRYIFGDSNIERSDSNTGIPPFAGYAIGYHVVQDYLRNTGMTVEEATFVPSEEIIRESRFFD